MLCMAFRMPLGDRQRADTIHLIHAVFGSGACARSQDRSLQHSVPTVLEIISPPRVQRDACS
jgi:hypothetical protein